MHFKNYDFRNLPFSSLFQSYIDDFKEVADFFETNPFDPESIKKHAKAFQFQGNRDVIADVLKGFNSRFDVHKAALNNIKRLRDPQSLTIVTGQQLGIYGGPIYTFFKTLTSIHLARQLEEKLGRPVIPVFWLADEDHDYDEVHSIRVLNNDGIESFSLPSKTNGLPPVSDIEIPENLEELRSKLQSTLIDTDFSDDLWQLLDQSFTVDDTFREAFARFITQLFSKHGLVLAGSNDPKIKQHVKEPMIRAVQQPDIIREELEKQSYTIESKFHRQATVYDSHLFYLHPEDGRIKIQYEGDQWQTEAGQEWSTQTLVKDIESSPERFSPDVFLRPILQDRLLPTLGYVAGPGEIAYYGQMKSFYRCFDQQMPVIFPRLSATFIEPAIDRIFHELPFEMHEYNSRIEDLESDYIEETAQTDVEQIFDEWKKEAQSVSTPHINHIASVDDTLGGAAEKVITTYFNELNKLKGKTYRAIKKREKIQLNRIRRIQQNIFPGGSLQERNLAGIYYMNKFGVDIWDRLLNEMEEVKTLDKHRLIYL